LREVIGIILETGREGKQSTKSTETWEKREVGCSSHQEGRVGGRGSQFVGDGKGEKHVVKDIE